jgi:hypothetical protein
MGRGTCTTEHLNRPNAAIHMGEEVPLIRHRFPIRCPQFPDIDLQMISDVYFEHEGGRRPKNVEGRRTNPFGDNEWDSFLEKECIKRRHFVAGFALMHCMKQHQHCRGYLEIITVPLGNGRSGSRAR